MPTFQTLSLSNISRICGAKIGYRTHVFQPDLFLKMYSSISLPQNFLCYNSIASASTETYIKCYISHLNNATLINSTKMNYPRAPPNSTNFCVAIDYFVPKWGTVKSVAMLFSFQREKYLLAQACKEKKINLKIDKKNPMLEISNLFITSFKCIGQILFPTNMIVLITVL
jgi:hypothetical protein